MKTPFQAYGSLEPSHCPIHFIYRVIAFIYRGLRRGHLLTSGTLGVNLATFPETHCWRGKFLTEFPQEIQTPPARIARWIHTESPILQGLDCYVRMGRVSPF